MTVTRSLNYSIINNFRTYIVFNVMNLSIMKEVLNILHRLKSIIMMRIILNIVRQYRRFSTIELE